MYIYVLNLFMNFRHQMCHYVISFLSGSRHQVHINICLTYSVVLDTRCTIICLACSVVLKDLWTFYTLTLFDGSRHQMYMLMCFAYKVSIYPRYTYTCICVYLFRWNQMYIVLLTFAVFLDTWCKYMFLYCSVFLDTIYNMIPKG